MSGESSDGLTCYPGYMTICPTTPCWMGAYSSPNISSWGLSLFDFLTFDTRQAGREVETSDSRTEVYLCLVNFLVPCGPSKGIESQSIHGGLVPRYPHPTDGFPHPWILKVPFSWTSVSTDSESADTESQLYLFLKSVFLMILEGHELFITMEGLFSFSSSEFIGIHGEWQL